MAAYKSSNEKIVKNTLMLYFRTILVMGLSIYTSRIVLDVLGVDDYGIYNVVGGFVSMFSLLSATMIASSQRFLSYELGKDCPNVEKVFSTAVSIHIILAFIVLLLLETFGLWFIYNKMNIAPERLNAAVIVFHFSVATFCFNIISIPYNAIIIANEKMKAFAYISIYEVLIKLLMIYSLYLFKYDVLILYALFMFIISISLRFIYGIYSKINFSYCSYKFILDKSILKNMLSFSGWNFIGSSAAILNNQGINVLINIFFGVALNAARGLATQIDTAINTFVNNFMMAIKPQITKSMAAKDYVYTNVLLKRGTRFSFMLFLFLALPVFFNIEYILSLWLKEVPEYANIFVKYAILYTLIQSLSQCLYTVMLASGNIKKYQLIVGTLSLFPFPLTYIFYINDFPVEYGYISTIIFSFLCFFVRIILIKEVLPLFSIKMFFKEDVLRLLFVLLYSILISVIINKILPSYCFYMLLLNVSLIMLLTSVGILFLGLTLKERNKILNKIKQKMFFV